MTGNLNSNVVIKTNNLFIILDCIGFENLYDMILRLFNKICDYSESRDKTALKVSALDSE
jgi:hypothetical protein